jgi:hypothetical protein
MNADDLRADPPGSSPAPPASPAPGQRRARWPWVLGATLLLMAVLMAVGAMTAWALVSEAVGEGVAIVVNGHRFEGLPPEHALGALAGIGLAGMLVVGLLLLCLGLIVPLVLSLVLLILGLVFSAVLAVAGVALVLALSPLWLPLLLLWWLLRPSRRRLASSPA